MAYRFAVAAALALTVLGTTANVLAKGPAQGLVTTQKLSAALAQELVGESVAACAANGYTVTAPAFEPDGGRHGLLAGDGAPLPLPDHALHNGSPDDSRT